MLISNLIILTQPVKFFFNFDNKSTSNALANITILITLTFLSTYIFYNSMSEDGFVLFELKKLDSELSSMSNEIENGLRSIYNVAPLLYGLQSSISFLASIVFLSLYNFLLLFRVTKVNYLSWFKIITYCSVPLYLKNIGIIALVFISHNSTPTNKTLNFSSLQNILNGNYPFDGIDIFDVWFMTLYMLSSYIMLNNSGKLKSVLIMIPSFPVLFYFGWNY